MQKQLNILNQFFSFLGLILVFVVLPLNTIGQPEVRIDDYTACINSEVLIPIEIKNFEDIAAITLYIGINTSDIEFIGLEDVNSVFSSGDFMGGSSIENQNITLTWFSLTTANLDSGLMCNMRVLLKNDITNFNFQESCEIVRSDLSVIENVEYKDGSLVNLVSLSTNPGSQIINEGNSTTINLVGFTEGIVCQWQEKSNDNWINLINFQPYAGVQTNQLSINSVKPEMNGTLYRCLLSSEFCNEISNESELLVSPEGIEDYNDLNQDIPILVYPNPFVDHLSVLFNENVQSAELRLVSMKGEILKKMQLGDIESKNVVDLHFPVETGIYVMQLFKKGQLISTMKVLRK